MFTGGVWGLLLNRGGSGIGLSTILSFDHIDYVLGDTADLMVLIATDRGRTLWLKLGIYQKSDASLVTYLIDREVTLVSGDNYIATSWTPEEIGGYYALASFYRHESDVTPVSRGGQAALAILPVLSEADAGLDSISTGMIGENETPAEQVYSARTGINEPSWSLMTGVQDV